MKVAFYYGAAGAVRLMNKTVRLFSITGWRHKWIWEIERGPFRSFRLTLRRELRRWI